MKLSFKYIMATCAMAIILTPCSFTMKAITTANEGNPQSNANMPKPEPFDAVFERFDKIFIPQCEEIMRDLPFDYPEKDKDFEILRKYISNIKADDIAGIRRSIGNSSGRSTDLPYWLRRTTLDIIGFRRALDQMLIINLANNNLHLNKQLQEKLKKYWDAERYYSLRFEDEACLVEVIFK
jgi:hypothetical protein